MKWSEITAETGVSRHFAQQIAAGEHSLKDSDLKTQILEGLKVRPSTLADLAEKFKVSRGTIVDLCDEMKAEGVNIHAFGEHYSIESAPPANHQVAGDGRYTLASDRDGYVIFGVTSDNHLCSKYSRLDVLNTLYDRFQDAGVTQVFNAGNWIDGEARFNKFDLLVHGMNQQVTYFVENYPQRKDISTSFVAGDDHEGWYCQREGVDIGLYTEMKAQKGGRNDLKYLGYMESYIDLIHKPSGNSSKLLVCHPGGGSSYAISYTSQKSVEAYDGGEKPALALYGHYHKLGYNYIRNVHAIQTGCTEDQTPFMRKKKISAHLGGVIVEAWLDDQGAITRCRPEFITFFDRKYYQNQWNMSGSIQQQDIRKKK